MPRYFLDVHDGDALYPDHEGLELANIWSARDEATFSLAEIGRGMLPGRDARTMFVEVRDERRRLLVKAQLAFEAQPVG